VTDPVAASTPPSASGSGEAKELSAGGDSGSESGNESDSDGDSDGDGNSDSDGDSLAEPQAERAGSEQTAEERQPVAAEPLSADGDQSAAVPSAAPPATGLGEPPVNDGSQRNEPEERRQAGPESAGQHGQSTGAALRRPVLLAR
jgi:hypothetical protein